uniref:NADH dehydrogenase subunit 2 n=1 Tax=Mecistocirrus digitatus TaxID=237660 RepID=D3J8D4_MECDI|nr:NADH dehydrogenase subunit 2 [Mecistocirrus digitatus]ACX85089.1 NADH dehydrogenase subunit 2 [Mecistocirrus digitatus]
MLFMFCIMVIFLSILSMMINNMIVWWSIFLLMTLLFILMNKLTMSYSSLYNYFILQESLGLLFLLLTVNYVQLMILLMKIGVAPMHFWIFSITNGLSLMNLMWFLTLQKLPFLLILLQIMLNYVFFLLIFGLFVCMMQMLMMKSYKNLMVLSSTESFNWILMSFIFSFINVVFVFMYYFFLMLYLINKFNDEDKKKYLSWETVLVFMNLPFSVNFFVKIIGLSEVLKNFNLVMLILLFMMFMSMLSLSFWMIILSVKNVKNNEYSKVLYFVILPSMLLLLI